MHCQCQARSWLPVEMITRSSKKEKTLTKTTLPLALDEFSTRFHDFKKQANALYHGNFNGTTKSSLHNLFDVALSLQGLEKGAAFKLALDVNELCQHHFYVAQLQGKTASAHEQMQATALISGLVENLQASHEPLMDAAITLLKTLNLNPSLIKHDLQVVFVLQLGKDNLASLRLAKGKKKKIENLGHYKTVSEVSKRNKHQFRVFTSSTHFDLDKNFKEFSHACHTVAQCDRGEMRHHYRVDVQNNSKKVIKQSWADLDPSIIETCNIMADDEKSALDWMAATETHAIYTRKNISQKFYQVVESHYRLSI